MADGIIIIDKPQDWTSMDVCAKLRGIFHERRIGHAGTLDPMATGVLPVFVGRATRAVEFASESEKEYVAGLRLGVETNTQDTTGTVLAERPVSVSQAELEQVLGQFRGEILQIPPMYSAIKVGGKKLYELARKGQEVERQPRAVTIHSLTLEEQTGPADYTLRVRCSKGTYVRTLCHDIGRALASLLLGVDAYFADRPVLILKPPAEKKVRNGMSLFLPETPDGEYRVYGAEGTFLALSRMERGRLTTIKSFFPV